jgi:tRNA(Arg) A34 adenosine deaminase TadA
MSDDDPSNLPHFKENRYLTLAFEKLQNHPSVYLRSLHVAILVKGGRILSVGFNKQKKNSFVDHYAHHPGCTTHAEVNAILKVRKKIDLTGCKIYVARLKKIDRTLGNSKPCAMCHQIIKRYGISKIYYTVEKNKFNIMRVH